MPQGPERYRQDKAQHPSVGWRRQLPLQGSLLGENRLQSLLQGEVDAPQGADGGVHCRFAPQVSFKTRQGLAPRP